MYNFNTLKIAIPLVLVFLGWSAQGASESLYVKGRILRRLPGKTESSEFSRATIHVANGDYRIDSEESGFQWEFYANTNIELYLFKYPKGETLAKYDKKNPAGKPIARPFVVQEQAYIGNSGQLNSISRLDPTTEFIQSMLVALQSRSKTNLDSSSFNDALPVVLKRQFGKTYDLARTVEMENGSQIVTISFYSLASEVELKSLSFPVKMSNYPGRFLCFKLIWEAPQPGKVPRRYRAQAYSPFFDSFTTPNRKPEDVMDLGFNEFELISEVETNSFPSHPIIEREVLVRDYRHFVDAGNPVTFPSRDLTWPTNKAAEIVGKSISNGSKTTVTYVRLMVTSIVLSPIIVLLVRRFSKKQKQQKT